MKTNDIWNMVQDGKKLKFKLQVHDVGNFRVKTRTVSLSRPAQPTKILLSPHGRKRFHSTGPLSWSHGPANLLSYDCRLNWRQHHSEQLQLQLWFQTIWVQVLGCRLLGRSSCRRNIPNEARTPTEGFGIPEWCYRVVRDIFGQRTENEYLHFEWFGRGRNQNAQAQTKHHGLLGEKQDSWWNTILWQGKEKWRSCVMVCAFKCKLAFLKRKSTTQTYRYQSALILVCARP